MSALRPELLTLAVAAIAGWLVLGALGLVRPRHLPFVSRVLFPLGAGIGLALAAVGSRAKLQRSGRAAAAFTRQ